MKWIGLPISPGATAAETKVILAAMPEGTLAACVATPGGHKAEFAIPVKVLDGLQGGPWRELRVNVRQQDLDALDGDVDMIFWRPAWDGSNDCLDSGTFVRK